MADGSKKFFLSPSNIKNILNQGKAIWFAFYLPNNTAWNNQSESALWNLDIYSSFSITDTTKNQGTASSTASTTKYYLSTTTSKTSSSVLLSGTRSVAALAAGGTSSGSVTVKVPGGITRTTYY